MRNSLASRLATLYAVLLGVTVLLVIVASSVALVYVLAGFSNDIVIGKHEEARFMAARYAARGIPLAKAAPRIAAELTGLGMHVAVYDGRGKFLAGDPRVRPRALDQAVSGKIHLVMPLSAAKRARPPHHLRDWWAITPVAGGYVTFAPSEWLILTNLVPYWRIIGSIAFVAIVLSWFGGRWFARQALAPLGDVTESLRALARGDFRERRFYTVRGDEIAALTAAYNEATAGVARAMDQRRETEQRMRQFVADAGHELRTPLTVIGGYIDVLRRGAVEEPSVAKQILGTMGMEREHMRVLIDRLMRLARMDADDRPEPQEIDVAELFRSQTEAARRLDESREVDYSVEGVTAVRADRIELGEALWNLLENALKYAPGAPIHLRAFRSDGKTVISVRDEGPGMSEAERLHAFERFYRGEARGEIPGTGLGLAIAKRAVERAGGNIAIDSAPGHGTTVSIAL